MQAPRKHHASRVLQTLRRCRMRESATPQEQRQSQIHETETSLLTGTISCRMVVWRTERRIMLKKVGASGPISLGKKYAGQLFDLQIEADGSIVMRPVKVVPVAPTAQEEPARNVAEAPAVGRSDAWSTPERRLPASRPNSTQHASNGRLRTRTLLKP